MDRAQLNAVVEKWRSLLCGPTPEIAPVLEGILNAVSEVGTVHCAFVEDSLRFKFGEGREIPCLIDNAGHKIRVLCALLAERFNEEEGERVNVYGGSCSRRFRSLNCSLHLDFKNTQGDQWFVVRRD